MSGQAALSGAASGASAGAAIGSVIPGIGTAIGGAAGAVIGGIGGLFKKKKKSAVTKSNENSKIALNNAATDVMQRGTALADRQYSGYDPRQRVVGLGANENAGLQMASGLDAKYQPLFQRAGAAYSGDAVKQLMNPYTEGVINAQTRKINQNYDTQLGALNRKRGMMDAWGSNRGTQLELGLQKQRAQDLEDAQAKGYSDAFLNAQGQFNTERQSALQAMQGGSAVDRSNLDALMSTGAVERGQRQATTDFDYQQFLEKRDWDLNNFGALLDSMKTASGAINAGQPAASVPKPSTGGQIAGLASTIAGLWGGMKGTPGTTPDQQKYVSNYLDSTIQPVQPLSP